MNEPDAPSDPQFQSTRLLALIAWTWLPGPVAFGLDAHPTNLTIGGLPGGAERRLDRDAIEAGGLTTLDVETPWYTGQRHYEGVGLKRLLSEAGASAARDVHLHALNDYSVDISMSVINRYDHRFGIDQVAADQGELSAFDRAFVTLTACMTACCAALVIVLVRQNRFLSEARRELVHLAHHDHLTGLPKRLALSRRLEMALGDAGGRDGSVAVHILDLDHFKMINDGLGQAAGDELLRQVAGRLVATSRRCLRGSSRGDEFAIVQPLTGGREDAGLLASALVRSLCRPFVIEGREMTGGVSVGVGVAPADGFSADVLLRKADLALYGFKRTGAGAWAFNGDLVVAASEPTSHERPVKRTGGRMATGSS